MIWTTVAISNSDSKPESWTFDGPDTVLAAYDMARVSSTDYFIVCLIPGEQHIEFQYESVSMFLVEGREIKTPEVDGILIPKFHTRKINEE